MSRGSIYLLLAAFGCAWIGLTVWTVRRLWRPSSTAYERMVYHFGVRLFGIGAWVLFAIVFSLTQHDDLISPAVTAAFTLFTGLPIALWAGYFWGRGMARFYGLAE